MGVNLRDLIPSQAVRTLELGDLTRKTIALDAYNMLYQFLTAIRQPDGTPLMDSRGRVTSHLSGLFYRTINLLEYGIKPIYIFDGVPPSLKEKEIERRRKLKEEAEAKRERALREHRLEEARRYAQMASRLTDEMVGDAKRLLDAMGLPWVQAPAEGEAQAAYLARRGDAWATGSQDYDSILFGAPRLVRNLGITGKRKLPNKNVYVEVKPELIETKTLLDQLGVDREKLIVIAIMLGTDYNPGGIRGIGVKTALKIVKAYATAEEVLRSLPTTPGVDYEEIYKYFLNPNVTDNYKIEWRPPNRDAILKILVDEHNFNPTRVNNAVDRLQKAYDTHLRQKGLDAWFK